jgi:hypothetical protein
MPRKTHNRINDVFGGWPQDEDRAFNNMFKGALIAWAVWMIVTVGLLVGVIYVAVHFLSKVW